MEKIIRVTMGGLQVLGVLGLLVGSWLSLQLWAALLVCGAQLLAVGIAGELVLARRTGRNP